MTRVEEWVERCQRRRLELGWSYEQLSVRAGVSRATAHRALTGSNLPQLDAALELEAALGLADGPREDGGASRGGGLTAAAFDEELAGVELRLRQLARGLRGPARAAVEEQAAALEEVRRQAVIVEQVRNDGPLA